MNNPFTEDYYMRGPETGLSNYENYSWKDDRTHAYVLHLARHLGLKSGETILDFGCARGYTVKALRMQGYLAKGYDISEWAIENCDEDVKQHVTNTLQAWPMSFDWVHSKDTFEHIPHDKIEFAIKAVVQMARKGAFFIVPLTQETDGPYIYPADEMDSTHVQRLTLEGWLHLFTHVTNQLCGDLYSFTVSGSYHMKGLKAASVDYPFSTGFITIKRFA